MDDYISEEYIFNIGVSIAQLIIKRETDSKKLFKNTSLFKSLPCIEMKTVPLNSCGIILNCETLQRSKKKLPKAFLSNFGSLINVFNLTRDLQYKEISPVLYKDLKTARFKPRNTKYFWIDNGYLFIPDSSVVSVLAYIFSPDIENILSLSENDCESLLDSEFPSPDYMISTILNETVSQIYNSKRIPKDENSNLNSNEKSEIR